MIPRIEIYLPIRNSIAKFDKPIYVWYSMVYNIYICNIYLKNIVNICHLCLARIRYNTNILFNPIIFNFHFVNMKESPSPKVFA